MPKKPQAILAELPFLQIEEGVKKNQSSERLRHYLWTKVCERAEIEMKYIKLLQGWINDFNPFYNQEGGSEVYIDSEVVKKLVTAMKSEVILMMTTRQKMYNDIMAEDGVYNQLGGIRTHCQNGKNLHHLMEEFSVINDRKQEMFLQFQRHTDRKTHLNNEIEELEQQVAHRSRIATHKRGTERGAKRIDEMNNRLSVLRRHNDIEMDKIKALENELFEIGTSTKLPLQQLDTQLFELEDRRIRAVLGHVKQYLNIVQGNSVHGLPTVELKRRQKLSDLEGVDALMMTHWQDVSINAKRTEAGEKFKLRELFTVKNEKSKVGLHSEFDGGRESLLRKMETGSQNMDAKKSRIPFFSPKSKKKSANSEIAVRESSSSESYSADGRRSRLNFTEEHYNGYRTKKGHTPPKARSNESIEELELPPEIWCAAEVTRQSPRKQFLIRKGVKASQEIEEMTPAPNVTEYSQVSDFTGEDSDDDPELGKLRNVRVIAFRDNPVPAAGSELAFKKGQMIKQKVGKNEDGFCYGWTRDHSLGKKRYGYYRATMVRRGTARQRMEDESSD